MEVELEEIRSKLQYASGHNGSLVSNWVQAGSFGYGEPAYSLAP